MSKAHEPWCEAERGAWGRLKTIGQNGCWCDSPWLFRWRQEHPQMKPCPTNDPRSGQERRVAKRRKRLDLYRLNHGAPERRGPIITRRATPDRRGA